MKRLHTAFVLTLALLTTISTDANAQRRGGGVRAGGGGQVAATTPQFSAPSVRQTQIQHEVRSAPSVDTRQVSPNQQNVDRTPLSQGAVKGEQGGIIAGDDRGAVWNERGGIAVGDEGGAVWGEKGAVLIGENGGIMVGDDGKVIIGGDFENNGDGTFFYWDDHIFNDSDDYWAFVGRATAVVAIGAMVCELANDTITIVVDGVTYYYTGYAFYLPVYSGGTVVYQVVNPPEGAVVPVIPPGCRPYQFEGLTYQYQSEQNVYYLQVSNGFEIIYPNGG